MLIGTRGHNAGRSSGFARCMQRFWSGGQTSAAARYVAKLIKYSSLFRIRARAQASGTLGCVGPVCMCVFVFVKCVPALWILWRVLIYLPPCAHERVCACQRGLCHVDCCMRDCCCTRWEERRPGMCVCVCVYVRSKQAAGAANFVCI